ncbi:MULTISPECIES: cutinase family protein [unclassified Dietzia]|uniref:cutinase family protein n=1 Tax=unclassified Dietzia TaxID=2617939 RepID=UPI000D20FF85|nr:MULTISPECIES: cutinase family protein [unclassified Dietzia]AVZ40838.1 hypothetical protein CT688_16555 [Dietzia sp. JS16-p6b]QGW26449.1 pullulanase, type I [Dietzia sp. DQ12-45-1b]
MIPRKWTAATLSAFTVVATAIAAPPVASASNPEVCTPVVVIPLRGSGEGAVGGRSDGWQGPTLEKLLSRADLRGAPVLQVGAPEYPAVEAAWEHLGGDDEATHLFKSANMGAVAAYNAYNSYVSSQPFMCALPEIIFLGYSQGAIAARIAAIQLAGENPADENGPVSAVHLVGDPLQLPNKSTTFGGGSNGLGIARPFGGKYDSYYDIPNIRRASICHARDPICVAPSDISNFSTHVNYFEPGVKFVHGAGYDATSTDEVDFMGRALSTSIREARLRFGMGPRVDPIKAQYNPGETVNALYAWSTPARNGDVFRSISMYNALGECAMGLNAARVSGPLTKVTDLFEVTVNGNRVRDVFELFEGVPLRAGQTSTSVSIRVNNAVLADAAVSNFGPAGTMSGGFGRVDQFDVNRNGRLDGPELFTAYDHILSGYCPGGRFAEPWYGFWHASIGSAGFGGTTIAEWEDGPAVKFSMLARGAVPPSLFIPRKQRVGVAANGLSPNTRYRLSMQSDPTLLAEFTTNEDGFADVLFDLPADAAIGYHHFVIASEHGAEILRVRFAVREGENSPDPTFVSFSPESSEPGDPGDPGDPGEPGDPGDPGEPGDPGDPGGASGGSLGSLGLGS